MPTAPAPTTSASTPTNAGSPSICFSGCAIVSPLARCFISGRGKWYPGEPLPRWALGCYWRKDGVPIWEDPALIADDKKDYKYNAADARRFLEALTRRLDVDDSFIMTALEDVSISFGRSGKPAGQCRPLDSKLEDLTRVRRPRPCFRSQVMSGQDGGLRASPAPGSDQRRHPPLVESAPGL